MKIFGVKIQWPGKTAGSEPMAVEPGGSAPQASTPPAESSMPSFTVEFGSGASLDKVCTPGRFYVYRHRAKDGKVFYVGKG